MSRKLLFIGKNSGDGHDTEGENIGIGMGALGGAIAGGENNTAMGNNSLDALTTGDYNVAIGHDASTNATTEGVVLLPSLFGITTGSLPSITLTHELVVPKSIPIIFPIL